MIKKYDLFINKCNGSFINKTKYKIVEKKTNTHIIHIYRYIYTNTYIHEQKHIAVVT